MTKAALREQRRAQRIARRNRQRIIIGVIVLLVVVLIGFFVYKDYSAQKQASTPTPSATGTIDATPPAPSANAITTASGLTYEDLTVGDGAVTKTGDSISVNYSGWLQDGTKFDSSLNEGRTPFEFTLGTGSVIPGWDEGIQGMKVNGIRLLVIPPDLAYGASGSGSIPPNATLTFEVQLLGIK